MRSRLSIVVAVGGMLLAACASAGTPGSTPVATNSGIEGKTLAGPTCPVERPESPCPDRPVPKAVVDVWDRQHSKKIVTFTTDDQGSFRVALNPGDYYLDPQRVDDQAFPIPHPQIVTVRKGAYTEITIEYDTGIR